MTADSLYIKSKEFMSHDNGFFLYYVHFKFKGHTNLTYFWRIQAQKKKDT